MVSAPPDQPDQAQHTIPQSLRDECFRVVKGIYGKELKDIEFDSFGICWYELLRYFTDSLNDVFLAGTG